MAFQPRPERWGIRQFFFEFRPTYITNLENRVENWRVFTAPFNTRTESGEHLEWNYIPEFEHLDGPFEIATGIIVPAGSYQWTRFRAEANTATKRAWVVDTALWWGGFYGGTLNPLTGYFIIRREDAHAWVEVWDGRSWQTFDPTPASLRPGNAQEGLLRELDV